LVTLRIVVTEIVGAEVGERGRPDLAIVTSTSCRMICKALATPPLPLAATA